MMKGNKRHSNPFPGFREFKEDEAHLFFGREKQIDELLKKLRTSRFMAVLGDAGSGKSSLIKAGMIPSLHSGFMVESGASWNVVLTRPGGNPISNLSQALTSTNLFKDNETSDDILNTITETTLRRNNQGLVEMVRQADLDEKENLLIIVDQFEEIFSYARQEEHQPGALNDASVFVNLLLQATRQSDVPVFVIITLRSDFLGNCSEFNGLPNAINQAQYLIPQMSQEESRRAITGPLAVSNIDISPRLQDRLLNDLSLAQNQLPALQFTLKKTVDFWLQNAGPKEPLDTSHYEHAGPMPDAINNYAEKLYREIEDMKKLRITDTVFTMVTDQTNDLKDIRRPTQVKELAKIAEASVDEVIAVINKFRQPGFELLLPLAGKTLDENSVIDLCHESLMHQWRRFKLLIDEEQQSVNLYRKLARSAKLYQEGKEELWRDPDLMLAKTWYLGNKPNAAWAKRYDPYFERAITFLKASEDQKSLEINKQNRNWSKKVKKYKRLALVGLITALVFIVLTVFLFFKFRDSISHVQQLDIKQNQISARHTINTLANNNYHTSITFNAAHKKNKVKNTSLPTYAQQHRITQKTNEATVNPFFKKQFANSITYGG